MRAKISFEAVLLRYVDSVREFLEIRFGLNASLINHASASFAMNAASIFLQLLTVVLLARDLGSEYFGIYTIIFTMLTWTSVFVSFGMPTFLVREMSKITGEDKEVDPFVHLVFTIFLTITLLAVSIAIISPVYYYYFPGYAEQTTLVCIFLLTAKVLTELQSSALVGLGKVSQGQFIQLVVPSGLFFVIVFSMSFNGSRNPVLADVLLWQAIGFFISALSSGVMLFRSRFVHFDFSKISHIPWGKSIAECSPLFLVNALAAVQQGSIFVVLGYTLSADAVGIYRVAERLGAVSQFLRRSIERVLAPVVARLWVLQKTEKIESLMQGVCVLELIFCAAVFVCCALVGHWLLATFFGYDFLASWFPLLILTAGFLVSSTFGFSGTLLTMTNNANLLFTTLACTLLLQLSLAISLTPYFGVVGAALSSALSGVVAQYFLWRSAQKVVALDCSVFNGKLLVK